jgi:hypothetical protein
MAGRAPGQPRTVARPDELRASLSMKDNTYYKITTLDSAIGDM